MTVATKTFPLRNSARNQYFATIIGKIEIIRMLQRVFNRETIWVELASTLSSFQRISFSIRLNCLNNYVFEQETAHVRSAIRNFETR